VKRLVLIAVLAAAGIAGQIVLWRARPNAAPAAASGFIAALGGFRSLAAEAVWFRADRLQEEGRYVELAQLASTLTFLEPHVPEVWSYAAWNLAYNISVMMPTHEDRWRWVLAAMKLLRDEGLSLNPHGAELYRELAWLFELKMGTELDQAAALYRKKWRDIASDVASRNAWHELKMDPETMRELERLYAIDDWTNPLASAVYWAHRGLSYATDADRAFLREIIRQSLVIYRKPLNMVE
jgi:hypothetical protein